MTNPVHELLAADSMISTHEVQTQAHTVFLDNSIDEPSKYRELISILFGASEGDKINIFINSPGGRLDSAGAIIEGLKMTQASVVGHVIGQCHSAASMIMLNCENVVVYDAAECMVHTASFGSGGSTGNVKSHVDFTHSQVEALLDQTYKHFLDEVELEDLKKGCDLYFNAEQLRERIKRRHTALEDENTVGEFDDAIETISEAIADMQAQLDMLVEQKQAYIDETSEEVEEEKPKKKKRKPRKKAEPELLNEEVVGGE